MNNPQAAFSLRSGLAIQKLSDRECAVMGAEKLVVYEGPAELLLAFISEFSARGGADAAGAIDRQLPRCQALGAQRADLEALFEQLKNDQVIAESPAGKPCERILVVCAKAEFKSVELIKGATSNLAAEVDVLALGDGGLNEEVLARMGGVLESNTGGTISSLLVAFDLDVHALYKLNAWARRSQKHWMFVVRAGGVSFVSPVLSPESEACFSCFRINSIGSLRDVIRNASVEAHIYHAPPAVASRLDAESLTTCFHEVGALASQLDRFHRRRPSEIYKIVPYLGTVAAEPMTKAPGCFTCSF